MRKIEVLRTWTIKEGEKNGKPWKLSGVEANDEQGNPISEQLKTFANLPAGAVEVEVEVQEHERYGKSFLLKPTGNSGGGGGGGGGGGAAGGQLADLRDRIERLESQTARLTSLVDRREPAERGPEPTSIADDEDIPF